MNGYLKLVQHDQNREKIEENPNPAHGRVKWEAIGSIRNKSLKFFFVLCFKHTTFSSRWQQYFTTVPLSDSGS
jgi:hypothetical protein